MSATSALASTEPLRSQNPFETARLKLVRAILEMKAPRAYPSFPSPDDHEGIASHIREAAIIFDDWLAQIGAEVRDNATTSIDRHMFAGSFTGAIDGNETGVCEEQAEALRGYAEERRSVRRA